jgi:hypothetical protein
LYKPYNITPIQMSVSKGQKKPGLEKLLCIFNREFVLSHCKGTGVVQPKPCHLARSKYSSYILFEYSFRIRLREVSVMPR